MTEFRDCRSIPHDLDLSDAVAERLVAHVACSLLPGLERTVGAIDWRHGSEHGTDWTAEGFLPDETLIVLCLQTHTREVRLYLDTAFKPVPEPPWWADWLVVGILAGAVGVGVLLESVGWGVASAVLGFGAWVGRDVLLQIRAERTARPRSIDEESWRQRFNAAIDQACDMIRASG
ncbi:hypothetical protein [Polyangium jinanense]|uniref:Uncharacterized protein n=1 Tax=Polyangium jinanense TaxID=2829994 RepID=A0A9X3XAS3_9BACT|nr:hypothetical protein [Polyangium jinanense]MDC3960480.1 hypothetical protein [Polyangium jinanense]MDC3986747.1 hypothetical protein [Polyangium jinanense]